MARPPAPLATQPLEDVLEQLAERTPGPGGGTGAAVAVAVAAALVEMTAKFDSSIMGQARLARANALRARALELIEIERGAFEPVLEAQRDGPRQPAARAAAGIGAGGSRFAAADDCRDRRSDRRARRRVGDRRQPVDGSAMP